MSDEPWQLRGRPDTELSFGVAFSFCDDPKCGLHILSLRQDNTPICETVLSREMTLEMMRLCKSFMYEKAAQHDDP